MTVMISEAWISGRDGQVTAIEAAADFSSWRYLCPGCGETVRLHRQHKPSGPAPHFEHHWKNPECPLMKR